MLKSFRSVIRETVPTDQVGNNRIQRTGSPSCLRIAAWAALLLLAVSILPILLLAPYARPVADDFGYGTPVHAAILGGKSILAAIAENVRYTYLWWQGTFGSVVFFSIQPGAFSTTLYALTPFVMLAAILASFFLPLGTLCGANQAGRLCLGALLSFFAVQYLPSVADGVFWWNGASHYLLCHALGILFLTQQIRLLFGNVTGVRLTILSVAACIGALMAGGGNYSSALTFLLLSCTVTIYALTAGHIRGVKARIACAVTLCILAGLIVSMAAPGNAVRKAGFEQMNPVYAILKSFMQAFAAIRRYCDLKLLGLLMLCVPIFLYTVRERNYGFRFPLLVAAGGFCAFASLYTPPIYAMGKTDIPRLENLFWLAALTLLAGCAFYLAGWANRRFHLLERRPWRVVCMTACLIGAVMLSTAIWRDRETSSAWLALADLRSGEAAAWCGEWEERNACMADDSIMPPRFCESSSKPACLPKVKVLSWQSDLIVDGVPARLNCFKSCGGEVTFLALEEAMDYFGVQEALTTEDFSRCFQIGGADCIPLREFTEKLGYQIKYDIAIDTIFIWTK